MIKNEKQYKITRAQADRFRQALADLHNHPADDDDPLLAKARRDSLASQLDELEEQLAQYEKLVSGRVTVFKVSTLADLPASLIRARIATGRTQKQLAEQLGLKEQQIQRYEATDYQSASLARLTQVAEALNVDISASVRMHSQ